MEPQTDEKPVALVDLDGTLADFDGAMQAKMREIAAPGEMEAVSKLMHQEGEPDYLKARRHMIKNVPGFWSGLQPRPAGFAIFNALRELDFEIYILTNGPKKNSNAWKEKVDWCERYVPDFPVTVGREKGLVYGRVLFDDWPEYITKWLKHRPRGTVIMPAHPWNEKFSHPNVVRYDGSNYAEVVARLHQARSR